MRRKRALTGRQALAIVVRIIREKISAGDLISCRDDYHHDLTISTDEARTIVDAFAALSGRRGHVGTALALEGTSESITIIHGIYDEAESEAEAEAKAVAIEPANRGGGA